MRIVTALLFIQITTCFAQTQVIDSVYYQLPEVNIKAVSKASQLRFLQSEAVLDNSILSQHPGESLIPAINTVPGVRMEERSPGSYRLSIRGSLLRSPFGVRNVKIYLNDFPFTDAGGNTYLNAIDISNINSIRILKGPEASIFGANTGGAVLIDPVIKTPDSLKLAAAISTGSYGLLHGSTFIQKRWQASTLTFNQAYQKSEGYRENSAMQRQYILVSHVWNYDSAAQLKTLIMFSDMHYQTPGGLTLQQFISKPEMARPATKTLPGATEQNAGVYNTTIFAGVSNTINFGNNWKHIIALTGSHTDFKNPFITNYEQRMEYTAGCRTNLEYTSNGDAQKITKKLNLGAEWQQTNAAISNYGNNRGIKDSLQAADKINAKQAFVFARFLIDIRQSLLVEAAASYNFFTYGYQTAYPFRESDFRNKKFQPQLMPRIALSYKFTTCISWRISVSGGYSAPTIAEVRPSDNIINTSLQAEKGRNYETGIRLRDINDYLWLDVAAFYYTLQNAIVRRTNLNGTEYFVNAGGTKQPGLEAQLNLWLVKPRNFEFVRALQLGSNLTYNHFTFNNYKIDTANYSNNKLTGVPGYTVVESITIDLPARVNIYLQYYYAAAIPLNDANTVYADAYHLLQFKVQWKKSFNRFNFNLFAGIDNILNEKYSLGNDLNAAGGRYYNAAAPRNYYAGIKAEF